MNIAYKGCMMKISVIIPIYKVEPYLRQCLDSVVNQTYKNLEIILIDDGSPDNCGKICDEYAERDERIIVIHKENGGLSAARNDGIKRATGEWLAFVDSDDWCDVDYYEKLIGQLEDFGDVDILCANGSKREFKDGRSVKWEAYVQSFLFQNDEDKKELLIKTLAQQYDQGNFKSGYNLAAPWDKLYKRSFICLNSLWFDTSCKAYEDLFFNFQAFDKAKRVAGSICVGYHYRIIDNSIVRKYNPNKPQINYDVMVKLHVYSEKRGIDSDVMSAIRQRNFSMMTNAMRCYYFHPANPKKWREIKMELKEMIQWRYFQEAISEKHNPYLSWKQWILKKFLRHSWIWPVKVFYILHESFNKNRNAHQGGGEYLAEFKPVTPLYICTLFVLKLECKGRAA